MIDLRNPFIFAPVKLGYSDGNGVVTDKHISFYALRSDYLGAVALEPLYMDSGLREIPTQLGIDNDEKIEGLKRLVDVIHKRGAKVIAHLNHPGRMANPKIPGNYFISSTDKSCENGGATPKRMDRNDMEKVIELFVNSAKRAEKAGFDIIELQFGHGYLLAQFLSPAVNDRDDEYGGSFDNRIKFPLEVLNAVKNSVNLPIIARVSGDEMMESGIKLSEMIEFSKILKENGVSAVHVVAGSGCSNPPWFFQHMFIQKGKTWELAGEIKEKAEVPTIFVGRINSFEDIDNLKKKYNADYIALGRELVADPYFVGKYLGEVEGTPRPCLACAEGCLGGVKSGKGLQCVVNPEVITGDNVTQSENSKNYAVVGGGLAGMVAAITLKKRGHSVVIYEKEELGGQFNLASLPPKKDSLSKLVDYYRNEVKDLDIPVIFKEADDKEILNNKYDGVILATGSKVAVPPINGLDKYHWAEILKEENSTNIENKSVAVIGGGLIGLEIASYLLTKKNSVFVIEMLDEVGRGMEMLEKKMLLATLNKGGVKFYLNSRVTEINGNVVKLENETGEIKLENIDEIVLSTGMKSYNPLKENLEGKIPYYIIGDAKKVGNAQDAIRDAYNVAKEL